VRLYRSGEPGPLTSWSSSIEHAARYQSGFYGRSFGGSPITTFDLTDSARILDLRVDPRAGLAAIDINLDDYDAEPRAVDSSGR
jgi:hypothetical protein